MKMLNKKISYIIIIFTLSLFCTSCVHKIQDDYSILPQSIGIYKIGLPYKIKGIWYYPQVNYQYREIGIASWYGPHFHGKHTANGEIFDQYKISAAHRTLPLPSIVRVTNIENGRSLRVRVNDRGPFIHNRIIDMSLRATQILGFEKQGTAQVIVEIIENDSRLLANKPQK